MNREIAILFGIGGAALLAGIVMSQVEKSAIAGEMKKARDALFDVGPGCESITFKGGGDAPDPGALEQAGLYYFRPALRERLSRGMDDGMAPGEIMAAEADLYDLPVLDILTGEILYELFPECKERDPMPWPPDTLFSTFGMIWVFMKMYLGTQIDTVMAELTTS